MCDRCETCKSSQFTPSDSHARIIEAPRDRRACHFLRPEVGLMPHARRFPCMGPGGVLASITFAAMAQAVVTPKDLASLSIEELANLQVTSVSGRAERLSDAAASIYVVTGEAIRRSGATSLPEALRLAPNLQVARIDAGV